MLKHDFRYDLQKGLRRASRCARLAARGGYVRDCAEEGLGFDKAVETCKARMARYQVVPNMLVVPPALLLYLALGPDEKINYSFAGPTGPSNFESGVNGYETRAFRGCGVFTSTPFEVSDESDSMQMLQRSTQVGEFYRMKPPRSGTRRRACRRTTWTSSL